VGTDVRKLAQDGYPNSQVLGCDLRESYIELGHRLFNDTAQTSPVHFFTSDIFTVPLSPPSPIETIVVDEVKELAQLRGAVSHLYTGALFHLFDEDTQKGIALRLAILLRRTPGCVIFGRHQGLEEEGLINDHLGRYGLLVTVIG
jgi:hypothetical protein